MKKFYTDFIYLGFILLTSLLTVTDLFINVGRSANGDGLIHTLVPTLFAQALSQGNFPVGWVSGFANYGLPLGTVSQQLTTYLSALVILITHNPTLGFNTVVFLGTFFSCVFFYLFLRIYFEPLIAFITVFFFNFTPYRILNIYIRGALPEFFASVFFPLLLIASYLVIVKRNIWGLFLFTLSIALLTLTHPFMDIVAMFLVIPYICFLLVTNHIPLKKTIYYSILFLASSLFGILLTAYYTFPLLFEIKYFYYGLSHNHLTPNNFLGFVNFFTYQYPYFSSLDVFNRGFAVNVGILESIICFIGFFYFLYRMTRRRIIHSPLIIDFAVTAGIITVFMMLPFSATLYLHIVPLSNIQFPWRMLSAFIFIPPILLAFFLSRSIHRRVIVLLCIIIISFFAFPQLYGKNYTNYSYSFYTFTPYNLDAVVMNTIWTGISNDYPITPHAYAIVAGSGSILSAVFNESVHSYTTRSKDQIRIVDHTFYFPGWKAYVDGKETIIEYQDQNYRGVITFLVPPGTHTVVVKYTDTKIRLLGKVISIISILTFLILLFLKRVLPKKSLFHLS